MIYCEQVRFILGKAGSTLINQCNSLWVNGNASSSAPSTSTWRRDHAGWKHKPSFQPSPLAVLLQPRSQLRVRPWEITLEFELLRAAHTKMSENNIPPWTCWQRLTGPFLTDSLYTLPTLTLTRYLSYPEKHPSSNWWIHQAWVK